MHRAATPLNPAVHPSAHSTNIRSTYSTHSPMHPHPSVPLCRYDMKWDVKQAYLSAVERLAEVLGLNEPPPPPPPPRSDLSESAQLRPPYTSTRAFG